MYVPLYAKFLYVVFYVVFYVYYKCEPGEGGFSLSFSRFLGFWTLTPVLFRVCISVYVVV